MRRFRAWAPWLALVGLLLGASSVKAAVMTSGVRVTSGAAPYYITYYLGQDVSTMTINIRNAGTNAIVKTLSSTGANPAIPSFSLSKGAHVQEVIWDGTTTGGAQAPNGDYYAEVITTGAPIAAMTLLTPPNQFVNPATSSTFDGRGQYGGGVNKDSSSPYHNLAYTATRQSNASALTAVVVNNVDTSTYALYTPVANAAFDFISADILEGDGNIVATGQSSGNVYVLSKEDGSVAATYGLGRVYTRTMQAFGTTASPTLFFIDGGSTGGGGAGSFDYIANVAAYTDTSTPTVLVPSATLGGTPRAVAVNSDQTVAWVAGTVGSPTNGYIKRFTLTKENGIVTGATEDTSFTFTMPAAYPTGANFQWLDLSPDESILWYAINEGNTSDPSNRIIQGLDATTGVSKGAAYTLANLDFNPQDVMVTSGGNIYVTTYASTLTGTTSNSIAVVAPPDNGSNDTTRSVPFLVTSDTNVRITAGPTVTEKTFHSATIEWTTNVPADSTVNFGTTSGFYDSFVTEDTEPDTVTEHSVTIDNLEQNTTYYFQVVSNATGFTGVTSAQGSFTTNTLTISNVQVDPIGDTTATVRWTTNDPATTIVRYGPTAGLPDFTYTDNALVTDHVATLENLEPGATYYFTPESGYTSVPPQHTVGTQQSFTTLLSVRILSEALSVTTSSAALTVNTNTAVGGTLSYGTDRAALNQTANAAAGTSPTFNLASLAPGTTYYYQLALSNTGVAPLTTPISSFTTEIGGGVETTVTHNSTQDLQPSSRTNVDLGAAGSLLRLQRQLVPGFPVESTPLPEERYYHAAVAYNGYLYVIGGRNNQASGNSVDTVFYAPINADGSVGTWNTTTALPAPRIAIGDMTFGYNGYIYIIGGADAGFGSLNTTLYAKQNADGTLGPWQDGTPMPFPNGRDLGSAIVVDGYALISGGEDNVASPSTDPSQYMAQINADGSLGEWFAAPDLPSTRWFNRTRANAHMVYSYGGYNSVTWVDSPQIAYVAPNGDMTPLVSDGDAMNSLRYNFTAALAGGKLWAVAGRQSPNTPINEIEYAKILPDGTTGPWTVSTAVTPYSVDAPDGEAYNGRIYHTGGRQAFAGGAAANATPAVVVIPLEPDAFDPDGATYAYSGTVEGAVIDLGAMTNLRQITVNATDPNVEVRYRFAPESGEFSDWYSITGLTAAVSGGARYVQYELVLRSGGTSTPTVNSIAITTGANAVVALPGDVNMNGVPYERADAALALQIAGGLLSASDAGVSFANANVNGDSRVTIEDATIILRRGNGL